MYNGTDVISGVIGYDVYKLSGGNEVLDAMDFVSEEKANEYIQRQAEKHYLYCGCVYKTIDGVLQDADHLK